MVRRWLPALLAVAAALVACQLAVWAFWPRGGVVTPDAVEASQYFTAKELARAEDYRAPGFAFWVAQTLIGLAILGWLVARPPRWLARLTAEAGSAKKRPRVYPRVALTAAALTGLLTVASLPIAIVARVRSLDVGLTTRSWLGWVGDVLLGTAVQALTMALLALLIIALMRRLPRWWWLPASALVTVAGAVMLLVTPTVLDPLFNRFTPLQGQQRADIVALAEQASVDVGEVYVMDASRRTTAANAYVTGLGSTKRVVIYDNLLNNFSRDEQRLLFAHELAHQHYRDVPRGLLIGLLVAPLGLLAVAMFTAALSRGGRIRPGPGPRADARTVPALALTLALLVPAVSIVFNQLSRRIEARADTYALQLTDTPAPFIEFKRGLAVRNLSDPTPNRAAHVLLGTHPTTLERLGAGEAWARGVRP